MHYVLVHGAWHDGRCWDKVADELRSAGHVVSTPTLTGLGPRAAELTTGVSLSTHVQDIVDHLAELPDRVVLVGHSYAGLVVREAADRIPERVSSIVLVEGWIAKDGESMASVAPDWFMPAIQRSADQRGDGWRIPPPPAEAFGVDDPVTAAELERLVSDHPLRTFTDPTILSGAVDELPCTAIVGRPGPVPFADWATAFGWTVARIDGGHDLMLTAPGALARALQETVALSR
jgi:pimeloyl-ACP methyl ester carboxylesterase